VLVNCVVEDVELEATVVVVVLVDSVLVDSIVEDVVEDVELEVTVVVSVVDPTVNVSSFWLLFSASSAIWLSGSTTHLVVWMPA